MSRYGRKIVFKTLQDFGVQPETVTKKTKIGAVIGTDQYADFVAQLNAKLQQLRKVDPSHLPILTIGQAVRMASQLPGDSTMPGRRNR